MPYTRFAMSFNSADDEEPLTSESLFTQVDRDFSSLGTTHTANRTELSPHRLEQLELIRSALSSGLIALEEEPVEI